MILFGGHSKDISPSIDRNLCSIELNNIIGCQRETMHRSMHIFSICLDPCTVPKEPMREYGVWCSELQLITSNGTEPRSAIDAI